MLNKIHQKLCRIAKEILESDKPSDYQRIYDQTLSLFEQLVLIKNAEGFNKDFWQDLESNFDKAIDFIEVDDKGSAEIALESDEREELPPLMDTIKEIVNEIPETKPVVADLLGEQHPDLKFEKKEKAPPKKQVIKKRLNDKFSKGMQIDLNDRLAFIKHLFDQSSKDYQRVISQISTFQDWTQAKTFIIRMVKPDYGNWKGKELYEARFLKIVENNFL